MDNITKNIILTYARAVRAIQNNQIDPYINNIAKEIMKQWPSLDETNAIDWAHDIINADSNQNVVYTLNRIDDIIKEKERKKWICSYCGKNTYDLDIDYLIGPNHLACVLENDTKKRKHSEPDDIINKDKSVISNIQNQINNILTDLNTIKKKFDDDGK